MKNVVEEYFWMNFLKGTKRFKVHETDNGTDILAKKFFKRGPSFDKRFSGNNPIIDVTRENTGTDRRREWR